MKKFPCDVDGCTRSFGRAADVGRHKQAAHGIPGVSSTAKNSKKRRKSMKNATKGPIHDLTKKDLIAIIQVRIEALHYVKQMLEAM